MENVPINFHARVSCATQYFFIVEVGCNNSDKKQNNIVDFGTVWRSKWGNYVVNSINYLE